MYDDSPKTATETRDTLQVEQDRRKLDNTLDRVHDMLHGLHDRLAAIMPPAAQEITGAGSKDNIVPPEPNRCELAEKLRAMNFTALHREASIAHLLNNVQV